MTLGLCFWIIMIIWLVFGALLHFGMVGGAYAGASTLLLFVLFGLLGWQTFGAPLHKG
jgi:ABC-type polysaccharide/polyol phosphate export permease